MSARGTSPGTEARSALHPAWPVVGLPMGDGLPRRETMAAQIPLGKVERRSLDVYELAAVGGGS